MLNRVDHTLSQILLFKGCLSEEEIRNELLLENENNDDIDIDEIVNKINRWNEKEMISLQIESYQWIDNNTYYGWRPTVINDSISKNSMMSLTPKQVSFWKIMLNIILQNNGLTSLNAAYSLNRSGMLGIKNILSRSEILSLFEELTKGKYVEIMEENEFKFDDQDIQNIENSNVEENKDNKEENKYFVIGPRSFIDLKTWIEQKTEDSGTECVLCSDYVIFKGFKCGNKRCPNIIHKQCIENYFQSVNNNNYKCPGCQNIININNINQISQFIQCLNHPNNTIKIINDLKQKSREQLTNHNQD